MVWGKMQKKENRVSSTEQEVVLLRETYSVRTKELR